MNYTISDDEDEEDSFDKVAKQAAKRRKLTKDESDDDFGMDADLETAMVDEGVLYCMICVVPA